MRIGILTGGGDCPGLNGVIRGVVTKGIKEYGYEFVGFRDGWKGPLEALTMPLDLATVKPILAKGGTILGSSRTNPFKIENGVERIKQNLFHLVISTITNHVEAQLRQLYWHVHFHDLRANEVLLQ